MKPERTVLLLGSSLVRFTETGESGRLYRLVERELCGLSPEVAWHCFGEVLYLTASSRQRTLALLDGLRPDAVVFELPSYQFLHLASSIRFQRRWPLLYPAYDLVMNAAKRAGGGSISGSPGRRGGLFRAPRDLARAVIGVEAEQTVDMSLDYCFGVLDAIRARDIALVCGTPLRNWYEPDPEWCESQLQKAETGLGAYCTRHGILRYDVMGSLARAGRRPGLSADGVHFDLETNEFQARLIAEAVVAVTA